MQFLALLQMVDIHHVSYVEETCSPGLEYYMLHTLYLRFTTFQMEIVTAIVTLQMLQELTCKI